MNFEEIYKKALEENNLLCFYTPSITSKMEYLCQELVRVNSYMNLTAITDTESIVYRHIVDCLQVCPYIKEGARVIDIGCGGGFPTLPLAIARPDLEITALDSTAKKLEFVKGVAKDLALNVTTVSARAEELGNDPCYREKFDVGVSRAVARLSILNELCIPFVCVGGTFLAMKGQDHEAELFECKNAFAKLGAEFVSDNAFDMDNAGVRSIMVIKKIGNTALKYPRAYAKIKKSPLV